MVDNVKLPEGDKGLEGALAPKRAQAGLRMSIELDNNSIYATYVKAVTDAQGAALSYVPQFYQAAERTLSHLGPRLKLTRTNEDGTTKTVEYLISVSSGVEKLKMMLLPARPVEPGKINISL